MFQKNLRIKYVITTKNCFCYLSEKYYRMLEQGRVVQITFGNKKSAYFSCAPPISVSDDELGLNSTYARNLGIRENDIVDVRACYNLIGIKSLILVTQTKDDYDIMGMLAEKVQSTLLDQIRVVDKEQKIVIWITPSLYVVANVENVYPASPGRLDYLTEVTVNPPSIHETIKDVSKKTSEEKKGFNKFLGFFTKTDVDNDNKYSGGVPLVFRMNNVEELHLDKNEPIFNVYVNRNALPCYVGNSKQEFLFYTLNYIVPPEEGVFVDENTTLKPLHVRLCILEDFFEDLPQILFETQNLYCSQAIFSYFKAKIGAKAVLEQTQLADNQISKIEIHTSKHHLNDCVDRFKLFVNEQTEEEPFLLNSDVPFQLNNISCLVKLPNSLPYCLIDSEFIRKCKITVLSSAITWNTLNKNNEEKADCWAVFENLERVLEESLDIFRNSCSTRNYENILIVGKPGSGKTTLTKRFARTLSSTPYYVHVERLQCKNMKGKSVDSLLKVFTGIFLNLVYYQPSLLLLDDLHVICEKVVDTDVPTQEALLFNKVSELLGDFLEHYQQGNSITVIATCESTLKLNQNIFSSRGRHFFKNVLSIHDLNKGDRKIVLDHLFEEKLKNFDVDMDLVVANTDGYVIQDLVDFVDKAIFESYKAGTKITTKHCEYALEKSTSLSLRDVQLHATGDRDFSDIGGLEDVKNILIETMMWPAKYSNLFAGAPLRLQSGLLLYGPPGTGKTLLAGAAAKHCGLRLISIKGPELLSKYIGASEQAVRDVFQKAQSAKPCILFFDEFDSLAPRRGHDSTGVTDRVVNQFLTQMDGVETLTGVCVLAATSRPDLLDPALLRPGRLDKQVMCPLPDSVARLAILKVLSKHIKFESGVCLEKVAKVTEGFSGADLQAVLYTAQLTAVEKFLSATKGLSSDKQVPIKQIDIDDALKNTRPSLNRQEKLKYENIYAKFQGKIDPLETKIRQQKATLA